MQQLISVWFAIDSRKRAIAGLTAVAMFAAVIGLSRLATSPNMTLLYSGLEPNSSGEVVLALEQQGVSFDVRNNSIFVDSSRRDELRMILAAEGLPANNGQGYELLDTLSGFGTTAQMFDAAYWRAKEGELARTIVAGPQFRSARVHISNSQSQPFRKSGSASASVTVTSAAGPVTSANAKALKYLVSSAVAGMSPEDVSVIDGRSGIVVQDDNDVMGAANGNDRAQQLKRNVERLLEARVGAGKVIVEVFVDTTTEREVVSERIFDPDSRVAISSQRDERSTSATDTRGGAVTVASNLPDGDAAAGDNNSSSQNSETSEIINYEVSETTRDLLRLPGATRRISVAVLVDGLYATDPVTNTTTWSPRSEEELAALRELVVSAIGYDAERGDTIALKSLQFLTAPDDGTAVTASLIQKLNIDIMRLIQLGVLAVVALVLGLFVLRPILGSNAVPALTGPARDAMGLPDLRAGAPTQNLTQNPALNPAPNAMQNPAQNPMLNPAQQPVPGLEAPLPGPAALTGEIDDRIGLPPGIETVQGASVGGMASQGSFGDSDDAVPADPVERLREMISDRQDETVEILRSWIDGNEEHA